MIPQVGNMVMYNILNDSVEDSYTKHVELGSEQYMMEIMDTAGSVRTHLIDFKKKEILTAMRDLYMKKGEGFLLVYSIITESTFEEIPDIVDQIFRIKDSDMVIHIGVIPDDSGSLSPSGKQVGFRRGPSDHISTRIGKSLEI
jgi:hypothetical protein